MNQQWLWYQLFLLWQILKQVKLFLIYIYITNIEGILYIVYVNITYIIMPLNKRA